MNQQQTEWLAKVAEEAVASNHVFPEMAACEAALESGFGSSALARQDFNLFGMKQHFHPVYETVSLPTKEFLDGDWKVFNQEFVKYENFQECFEDRMATLVRLAPNYPHYQAALSAPDAATYIQEVSKTWSSDPGRAAKVQAIYEEAYSRTKGEDVPSPS